MNAGQAPVPAGTVVVQSFRSDPPAWIGRCLESVRAWADDAGFAYRFLGDELFDRLPVWVRAATAGRVQVASDLARLELLAEYLHAGWRTAIWLDADVLVFDPAGLREALDLSEGYLLGREAWVQRDARSRLRVTRGVHNALLAMSADNAFLAFYRHAATRILARHEGAMVPQLIGPKFLKSLDNMIGLPATWALNMASPPVLAELAGQAGEAVALLRANSGQAPSALNLCLSYAGRESDGVQVDDASIDRAIGQLLATGPRIFS